MLSQTLSKLEEKNGFNKFKLGTNSSLCGPLSLVSDEGKIKCYSYQGDDIKEIYSLGIHAILMTFYKDQLYKIQVYINKTDKDSEIELGQNLKVLFGKPNSWTEGKGGWLWEYLWQSQTVQLQYAKFDEPEHELDGSLIINITKLPLRTKVIEEGF